VETIAHFAAALTASREGLSAMHMTVRTSDASLMDLVLRRFAFALGRFHGRVRSVTIRLTDVNGPRGGVDKQCRVTAHVRGGTRAIVLEDIDADAAVAVDRAADRTARAVARAVHTLRDWRAAARQQQEAW
jgi:putative sigma-54 modulation protein